MNFFFSYKTKNCIYAENIAGLSLENMRDAVDFLLILLYL